VREFASAAFAIEFVVQLGKFSARGLAGVAAPVSIEFDLGDQRVALDPAHVYAVPYALTSLLYPASMDDATLALLSAGADDAEWRIELNAGEVRYRMSRRSDPASVVLEIREPGLFAWNKVAVGAQDASKVLDARLGVPSFELFTSVFLGANETLLNVRPGGANDTGAEEPSRLALLSNEDYFGDFIEGGGLAAGEAESRQEEMSSSIDLLCADHARARRRELIEDQIASLNARTTALIEEMSAQIDATGELAEIERQINELPPTEALDEITRDLLTDPDRRIEELRRKLEELERDGRRLTRIHGREWYQNPLLMGGIFASVAITLVSVFGGVGARRLAVGNVFVLGIALLGALRQIASVEGRDVARRQKETAARRREVTEEELRRREEGVERLRRTLGVQDVSELDAVEVERADLLKRRSAIEARNSEVIASDGYQELLRQRDTLQVTAKALRGRLAELEEATVPAYESAAALTHAGIDPHAVCWTGLPPNESFRRIMQRLYREAEAAGLTVDGGMSDAIRHGVEKMVRRLTGSAMPGVNVDSHGRVTFDATADVTEVVSSAALWIIAEAFRFALLTSIVPKRTEGYPRFLIRVNPLRAQETGTATQLKGVYEKLGGKLQVVILESQGRGL